MKKSKKWYIIAGIVVVLALVVALWGRALFMYAFINILLKCDSEEECKKAYARFLQNKSVYESTEDVTPWTYKAIQSEETGIWHRYFYLPSKQQNTNTIVMLHGFNTDARSFLNFHPLSERYNLVSYFLPESSPYYKGSFSDFIPILNDLLSNLGLDSAIFVGSSMGGAIASHYASLQKEKKVEALILVASTNFGAVKKDMKRIQRMRKLLLKHEDYRLYNMMVKGEDILTLFREKKQNRNHLVKKNIDWYRQILNSLDKYGGIPGERDNDFPVLAVHGENDRLLPSSSLQEYERAFQNITYQIIPNGGHTIWVSKPNKVIEYVEQFLKKHDI